MKNLTLLIFTLLIIQLSAYSQPCLPEGITLTTQAQIDNFQTNHPNCTEIEGDVEINGYDITNLNGLHVLTSIGGDLVIGDRYGGNPALTSLAGLDNLISIGGDLVIGDYHEGGNPALTSLAGLDNLTSIGGGLHIRANHALTSLIGLDNVDSIGGGLSIWYNYSLSTCEVQSICDYLVSPNGSVNIYNNESGCNNPAEVANACGITLPCLPFGNYYFFTQAQIDSFQINYPNCTEIEGIVTVKGGDITNLNGLNVLTSIEGTLYITENDALTSLTGLENLTYAGGLIIGGMGIWSYGNPSLISLTGLSNLTSIGGDLIISNNNALTSLTGLDNLTSIEGRLWIKEHYSLTSLTGLENLTYAGGLKIGGSGLQAIGNPSLISLTSLSNLTSIGGDLEIDNNHSLTSLMGLDNIDAASIDDLEICDNFSLSTCEVESICNYLASPSGTIEIHDNATGCKSQAEVESACVWIGVPDVNFESEFSIYPNPAKDILAISNKNTATVEEVVIYNQIGQKVFKKELSNNTIDVSSLQQGMYILEVVSREWKVRKKLIIR